MAQVIALVLSVIIVVPGRGVRFIPFSSEVEIQETTDPHLEGTEQVVPCRYTIGWFFLGGQVVPVHRLIRHWQLSS